MNYRQSFCTHYLIAYLKQEMDQTNSMVYGESPWTILHMCPSSDSLSSSPSPTPWSSRVDRTRSILDTMVFSSCCHKASIGVEAREPGVDPADDVTTWWLKMTEDEETPVGVPASDPFWWLVESSVPMVTPLVTTAFSGQVVWNDTGKF